MKDYKYSLRKLIERLTFDAKMHGMSFPCKRYELFKDIGRSIKNLSQDEKELLSKATPEDFNLRIGL